MFAHVAYVCILSEMYGASGASGTIRRGGSETGLSGEAACSTWEVARWEKHRVSCKEILCVCYLNLINICSCYDMMVMVQPFNSCLKTTISEAFPVSCLFLGCEQMSQQRVVWRLQAVGVTQRGSLSLSFQTSLWEAETDSCAAARCQRGVSEWPRRAGAIYNKGTFWLLYFDITAAETTTRGRRLSVGVSCFWSILMRCNDQSI